MTFTNPGYTIIDHTADLGISVQGIDLITLFKNAGYALIHLMIKNMQSKKSELIQISISGNDLEDLMVRWLGEILYLFEGEGRLISSIKIDSISENKLEASLKTIIFDPSIHKISLHIKAVTYHQIEVVEKDDIWKAKVIFDV